MSSIDDVYNSIVKKYPLCTVVKNDSFVDISNVTPQEAQDLIAEFLGSDVPISITGVARTEDLQ